MNCQSFYTATHWDCTPAGINTLQVYAPITLGNDGQHVSFYVMEDRPGHFYLTDAHNTILHAMSHGAKPTPSRLKKIAGVPGARSAQLNADGEIVAEGYTQDLKMALWDALRLALAISNQETEWQPKTRQDSFAAIVAKTLRTTLPADRVLLKPKLLGASGHQMEFPLGIVLPTGNIRAVQPIGVTEDNGVDWSYIYQSAGKLSDLQKASADDFNNRVVIMEQGAANDEFSRAMTMLAPVSRIVIYNASNQGLAQELLAA